ncbi:MAG: hypothetical protein AAGJ83_10345, partial [Planctomycetota bacterium]
MKRHEKLFGPKVWGTAILAGLVGATSVSAQMSMPGFNQSSKGNSGAATTAVPSYAQVPANSAASAPITNASAAVARVKQLIQGKQFEQAVGSYRQLVAAAQKDQNLRGEVAKLRVDLQMAGIDAELLSLPAAPAAPLPSKKQQALRLLAIGRAALDRGDTAQALNLARQAQSLRVPESDFQPGEPRVWQFVLDAESAARRAGTMTPNGNASQIALAGGTSNAGDEEAQFIQQMLFNGESTPGAVQPVQALGEPTLPAGEDPNAIYQQGLNALQNGDQESARKLFVEAWKYEGQLDLATRRQLKDKLTLLQPTRLPRADSSQMSAIDEADLASKEATRRLYREITAELAKSAEMNATAPLDALDSLNRLRRRVDGASIDEMSKRTLARMVDSELEKQKQYVEANRAQIELDLQNDQVRMDLATNAAREARIDEEISSLVETFNQYIEERKFAEAETIAKQVGELKPGSEIATTMFYKSRLGTRNQILGEIQDGREELFWEGMMRVEEAVSSTEGLDPRRPMTFGSDPQSWHEMTRRRLADTQMFGSVQEQKLKAQLTTRVSVQFRNRPLEEVINDLSKVTNIPMVLNRRAMEAVNVPADTPVSLELPEEVELKSALNLILEQWDLGYEIDNEVVQITSRESMRAKVEPRVYKVADLVTPIPNFVSSYEDGLAGALRAAYQMTNPQMNVQMMPFSATDIATRQANALQPSRMGANMLG